MNPPAKYYPFQSGKYSVNVNTKPLSHDFGNKKDKFVIQIDDEFHKYRQNKLTVRLSKQKPYQQNSISKETKCLVNIILIEMLIKEYPDFFSFGSYAGQTNVKLIHCNLTKEKLYVTSKYELMAYETQEEILKRKRKYEDLFDALMLQIQEDVAIVELKEKEDCTSLLHVCAPSGWAPENQLNKSFSQIHALIPGMKRFIQNPEPIVKLMFGQKPLVRFVWGLSGDHYLNHHPKFWELNKKVTQLSIRVERQIFYPVSEKVTLFIIRPFIYSLEKLEKEKLDALREAIKTMTQESKKYKGITKEMEEKL